MAADRICEVEVGTRWPSLSRLIGYGHTSPKQDVNGKAKDARGWKDAFHIS